MGISKFKVLKHLNRKLPCVRVTLQSHRRWSTVSRDPCWIGRWGSKRTSNPFPVTNSSVCSYSSQPPRKRFLPSPDATSTSHTRPPDKPSTPTSPHTPFSPNDSSMPCTQLPPSRDGIDGDFGPLPSTFITSRTTAPRRRPESSAGPRSKALSSSTVTPPPC